MDSSIVSGAGLLKVLPLDNADTRTLNAPLSLSQTLISAGHSRTDIMHYTYGEFEGYLHAIGKDKQEAIELKAKLAGLSLAAQGLMGKVEGQLASGQPVDV